MSKTRKSIILLITIYFVINLAIIEAYLTIIGPESLKKQFTDDGNCKDKI